MEHKHPEPTGVLLINKPAGLTSHDVVGRIRRLYGTRRVGHTGTLDPMATGVLVLLLGRAAKAAEYLSVHDKCYVATLRLGITTDTEDTTGEILTTCADLPAATRVLEAASAYCGRYRQTPPMYSALKVNGQKLLDLARRGIEIEREAREVTVHKLTVTPTEQPACYTLTVACSAGTYIRTLCADIGRDLGCGGAMAALCRTKTGDFALDDCYTLEALEQMDAAAREACLLPTERLFDDLTPVCLPPFFEKLARSGCEIYQSKIKTAHPVGARVRLCDERGSFFAIGEVRTYEGGTAIKAVKTFVL
ncbi:MAG: tRNA pseudouridine(55) synthase TruB [Ruminococcaceae bacterium]|nr:tRNA pseudouridine(55) synthase TruB [Oscillospiraceae bacterium]